MNWKIANLCLSTCLLIGIYFSPMPSYGAGCGGDPMLGVKKQAEMNWYHSKDVYVGKIVSLEDLSEPAQAGVAPNSGKVQIELEILRLLKGNEKSGTKYFDYAIFPTDGMFGGKNMYYEEGATYLFYTKEPYSGPCGFSGIKEIESEDDLPKGLQQVVSRQEVERFKLYDRVQELILKLERPSSEKLENLISQFHLRKQQRLNKTDQRCEYYTPIECKLAYNFCSLQDDNSCQKATKLQKEASEEWQSLCEETGGSLYTYQGIHQDYADVIHHSHLCVCPEVNNKTVDGFSIFSFGPSLWKFDEMSGCIDASGNEVI